MHHRLYYHIVWTTRDRAPLIDAGVADFLCRFLSRIAIEERARILEFGVVQTHVHLLLTAHPTTVLPKLMQRLKGGSGMLINREKHATHGVPFRWDDGYHIQTVSPRAVTPTRQYIRDQPTHHPSEAIPGWRDGLSAEELLR